MVYKSGGGGKAARSKGYSARGASGRVYTTKSKAAAEFIRRSGIH